MIRALNRKFQRRSHRVHDAMFVRAFRYTAQNFTRRSNLHGFKYMDCSPDVQRSANSCIASIIWHVTCLMACVLAVYLIRLVAIKYGTTPTITTVETNNYPIWNVQFPAVTLCNINKVYAPATENIRKKLMNKGLSAETVHSFLSQLSGLVRARPIDEVNLNTYKYLEQLNYTTKSLMLELIQPCDQMVLGCMWLGKVLPCESIFRVTMSPEGFCCSFNQKALKSNLEIHSNRDSVSDQLNRTVYRVAGYGEHVGLNVLLNVESDAYVSPRSDYEGISVIIHEAEDFPESSYSSVVVQPGEEVAVAIVPRVVISQSEVRSLPVAQRNCLFHDEKRLRTTDRYSYQSCLTECVVDAVLENCGCIPFFYPHLHLLPYSLYSRQCSLHDVGCLTEHNSIFSSFEPPWAIDTFNETAVRGLNCTCLPSCSEQFFRIQSTVFMRQPNAFLVIPEHEIPERLRQNGSEYWRLSKVLVFFKDISCIKYRREIYMSWDALIASFGGIFGLCLGGSVISLFEMAYYFTFRLGQRVVVLAMRQQRNRQKTTAATAAASGGSEDDDEAVDRIDLTRFGYNE